MHFESVQANEPLEGPLALAARGVVAGGCVTGRRGNWFEAPEACPEKMYPGVRGAWLFRFRGSSGWNIVDWSEY